MAFRGLPGTVYDLTYRLPDGSEETTRVETVYVGDIESTETIDPRPLDYEILPNNIGFIAIRNFTSSTLDNLWDAALETMLQKNVSGIIIDLRHNGGGFSTLSNYMLGSFLDSDVYAGREVSALDEDGDGERDIEDDFYYGRGRIFDPSRVVVLIGPDCFSACEFAAYAFKDIGAQVIGHLTSGGAGGGVGATYHLPGGTMVYGMGVVMSEDLDGNIIIEGIGVPLDVQVPFSAEALAAGEDTVLLTAISLLTD
jgi:C-terminal processing protease CtpA/Prc